MFWSDLLLQEKTHQLKKWSPPAQSWTLSLWLSLQCHLIPNVVTEFIIKVTFPGLSHQFISAVAFSYRTNYRQKCKAFASSSNRWSLDNRELSLINNTLSYTGKRKLPELQHKVPFTAARECLVGPELLQHADLKQEIEDPEGPIHTDLSNLWNIFLWGEREEEVMQQ